MIKKKRESLTSNQNQSVLSSTSKTSSHSATSLHLKEEEPINNCAVKPLLKYFFDLRGYLLQWHLLNADIKQRIKQQTSAQEIEFFNRFLQIISLQNSELELRLQNDYKIAIKHLEDILGIEFPTIKEVYPKIDHFINFASNMDHYLSSSLKKVFLGEGVSVDVQKMNGLIVTTEKLFDQIFAKHAEFFLKYKEIKDLLSENLSILKEQVEEIKGFGEEIEKNQKFINFKLCKTVFDAQESNLALLEKEFLM